MGLILRATTGTTGVRRQCGLPTPEHTRLYQTGFNLAFIKQFSIVPFVKPKNFRSLKDILLKQ